MEGIRVGEGKLLDTLAEARTGEVLDHILSNNSTYQSALEQQEKAIDKMDNTDLNRKQSIAVNQAISAVNHCGVVYGEVAYRLGLRDGINLMAELEKNK